MVPPAAAQPRTPEDFRTWLRALRERADLTQDELAAAVETVRRNIHRWETAGHDPGALTLIRILDAVGATISPSPEGVPRAINAELLELRHEIEQLREQLRGLVEDLRADASPGRPHTGGSGRAAARPSDGC